jgi:hypothetical protein
VLTPFPLNPQSRFVPLVVAEDPVLTGKTVTVHAILISRDHRDSGMKLAKDFDDQCRPLLVKRARENDPHVPNLDPIER